MRRNELVFALIAGGLACSALALSIGQSCTSDNRPTFLGVLAALAGSLLFATTAFLLAGRRSTRRWVPWIAALVTMISAIIALSVMTLETVVSNCTR